LYECVVSKSKEFDSYINDFVKNWELDRISRMDLSIIRLGIAEMTSFSNIPVKVTINECIDLAKNFSSQKSGKFVNGLLDVISLNLLEKGQIKKTGKGLIDNK
jgi:N utilization substance protein B